MNWVYLSYLGGNPEKKLNMENFSWPSHVHVKWGIDLKSR